MLSTFGDLIDAGYCIQATGVADIRQALRDNTQQEFLIVADIHVALGVGDELRLAAALSHKEAKCYHLTLPEVKPHAGTPTDNAAMEAINGWIKAELFMDFHVTGERAVKEEINDYIAFFNEQRPAYSLNYLAPVQFRMSYAPPRLINNSYFPAHFFRFCVHFLLTSAEHRRATYATLLTGGKLNGYLADIDRQAGELFSRLVKDLAEKENVTEELKSTDMMLWVQKMNNIRNRATEIVNTELIYF